MIIKYLLTSAAGSVVCCGEFRNMNHFGIFCNIEEYYKRNVEWFEVLKA